MRLCAATEALGPEVKDSLVRHGS